jgi:NitT/TauT family transport system substrate-binding protein
VVRVFFWLSAFLLGLAAAPSASADEPTKITIGVVRSLPAAAIYIAMEKGWFRDAGLEADLQTVDSAAKAIALLAAGHMQLLEGGLSVGYFNAVAQGLPMKMALEAGSSPVYQKLLVRPDLKDQIKEIKDLKGHSVAEVAPGSIVIYQIGKVLETAGLTLKDIEIKFMPFNQMGVALTNKGVDVVHIVSPFSELVLEKGFAVEWIDADTLIKPTPLQLLAFTVNTDWATKNQALARRLFVAMAKGGREYCQAYHHGPNRDEVMNIYLKYDKTITRELLERIPWQSRDPNGRFNTASVLDIQDWFFRQHMIDKKAPQDQLVDTSYADEAAKELGPFELVNKSSTLGGCR